jgi:hypothetical protein
MGRRCKPSTVVMEGSQSLFDGLEDLWMELPRRPSEGATNVLSMITPLLKLEHQGYSKRKMEMHDILDQLYSPLLVTYHISSTPPK